MNTKEEEKTQTNEAQTCLPILRQCIVLCVCVYALFWFFHSRVVSDAPVVYNVRTHII